MSCRLRLFLFCRGFLRHWRLFRRFAFLRLLSFGPGFLLLCFFRSQLLVLFRLCRSFLRWRRFGFTNWLLGTLLLLAHERLLHFCHPLLLNDRGVLPRSSSFWIRDSHLLCLNIRVFIFFSFGGNYDFLTLIVLSISFLNDLLFILKAIRFNLIITLFLFNRLFYIALFNFKFVFFHLNCFWILDRILHRLGWLFLFALCLFTVFFYLNIFNFRVLSVYDFHSWLFNHSNILFLLYFIGALCN